MYVSKILYKANREYSQSGYRLPLIEINNKYIDMGNVCS